MSSNSDTAAATFESGFNCAQAVLATFGPYFGLDRALALRVAQGFGGGMGGQMGETCGAVTGAMMAIGLRHGRVRADDAATRDRSYALAQELVRRFRQRNAGCLTCRELIGCDLGTSEGQAKAKQMDFHQKVCPKFIRDAAELLEELLVNPV